MYISVVFFLSNGHMIAFKGSLELAKPLTSLVTLSHSSAGAI